MLVLQMLTQGITVEDLKTFICLLSFENKVKSPEFHKMLDEEVLFHNFAGKRLKSCFPALLPDQLISGVVAPPAGEETNSHLHQ